MSEPFLAEIKIVSFGFAPRGWALCNGQLLPISQNQALFSLLGTTFGGDGVVNFALPNLQGRAPLHIGNGFTLGQQAGETAHTLNSSELPVHNHVMRASGGTGTSPVPTPAGAIALSSGPAGIYALAGPTVTLNTAMSLSVGGNQAHTNMQPYLTLNFIIALQGIYPPRN